jgi:hypothetical protein
MPAGWMLPSMTGCCCGHMSMPAIHFQHAHLPPSCWSFADDAGRSPLAAVGTWDMQVLLLATPGLTPAAPPEPLGGSVLPRSVLLVDFEGTGHLLVGLGDGGLLHWKLDPGSQRLTGGVQGVCGAQGRSGTAGRHLSMACVCYWVQQANMGCRRVLGMAFQAICSVCVPAHVLASSTGAPYYVSCANTAVCTCLTRCGCCWCCCSWCGCCPVRQEVHQPGHQAAAVGHLHQQGGAARVCW